MAHLNLLNLPPRKPLRPPLLARPADKPEKSAEAAAAKKAREEFEALFAESQSPGLN